MKNNKNKEKKITWYIPREHGAWSMWIGPFLIGSFISPWTSTKLFAFIGILAFYLSTAPLLAMIRYRTLKASPWPSFCTFIIIGCLAICYPVWKVPTILWYGLMIIPLFALNIYFAKQKKERLFINDLIAIIALSSTGLLAVHLGYEGFHPAGLWVWGLSILYYADSVFYVKTLIREKGNIGFRRISFSYHFLLLLIPVLMQYWWVAIIYLPTILKVILTPYRLNLRPPIIGTIETLGTLLFILLSTTFLGVYS